MQSPTDIERLFHARRRMLWGLCYRMTGVAADAEDLVQEAFLRALKDAPTTSEDECVRWLMRVATNLALDRLRVRRRRSYVGEWLPSPLETPGVEDANPDAATEYERREAVSYAFLVALERLAPKARAVLILRDVFDYPASEVAHLLDTSEANVRVLHHRARRRLEGSRADTPVTRDVATATRRALERFLDCMVRQDARGIEALLTKSVRTITDAGGEYTALHGPLVGASRVARFHLETARRRGPISHVEMRSVNGLPALVIETRPLRPQMAPRVVLRCEIDEEGRICELHSILASRKLTAIRFAATTDNAASTL
jgi:RNA polymerase sigma-70 factor (ECF subfamily)